MKAVDPRKQNAKHKEGAEKAVRQREGILVVLVICLFQSGNNTTDAAC